MRAAIDLRQLRYFLAVGEELNFGRAALRLHISQPPLSRQIRQLEDQLGVELFLRKPAGVVLTAAGVAFLPEVRKTLRQVDKALAVAREACASDGGRFVVGYTTVFDRSVIPDVAEALLVSFPDWHVVTRGKQSISLVRDVRNGSVDAAFIGMPTQAPGLVVETVFEQALVLALPASHRLAKKRRIAFDELGDEPMFWFERRLNPGFYDYCQAFFEEIGFSPKVIPEPSDHHILLGLIAEGQGIALIPASLQKIRRQGVVFRALKPESRKLSMGLGVAYAQNNRSVVLRRFLELVRAAAPLA